MSDSMKRANGFSLLEMIIAMALGTLVLGAAVQIYSQGVAATWTVSQRAELQQDFRAASNMLTRDISLAGAGLNPGTALALPSATTPVYGCDQTKCYINGTAGAPYPIKSGTPYLYGLLTGYNAGPTISSMTNDIITTIYTDSTFYLNCYATTITARGVVTFSQPAGATPWAGCLPNSSATAPQAINDSVVGLTQGDLVLMTLGGNPVVAEVTGPITTGVDGAGNTTYSVPFANNDALKMNQTPVGATAGLNSTALNASGTASAAPCGGTGPCRLLVITYYLDNGVSPPRLMRQVSGHTPQPVAENVAYMKFSYDLYNGSTNTPAVNQPNPGSGDSNDTASNGLIPNQITKVNILHMAMDSSVKGARGGYQGADLETSVSARNLTYTNTYAN
jgi:prepilin-type N-terminal cleavage/methylation domain-containing protein